MGKGRLLASVCAFGLLAAPAFAAGPTSGDMSAGSNGNAAMQQSQTGTANGNWHHSGANSATMGADNNATPGMNRPGMNNTGMNNTGMNNTGMNSNGSNEPEHAGKGMTGMNNSRSASGMTNSDRSGMSGSRSADSDMSGNSRMGRSHHGWNHAMRANGQSDTSQNSEIDRLNQQSLQAAQQGRSFDVGSADSGSGDRSGGMQGGGVGTSTMGNGRMSTGGTMPNGGSGGSGGMSRSGGSSGGSHM
jgi:hypothetical protein